MIIIATAKFIELGSGALITDVKPFNIQRLQNFNSQEEAEEIVREEIVEYTQKYNKGKHSRFHIKCHTFKIVAQENDMYFHDWRPAGPHTHRCTKCGITTNPNQNRARPCPKPPETLEATEDEKPTEKQQEILNFIGRMGCIHRVSENTYEALKNLEESHEPKRMRKTTFDGLKPFLYEDEQLSYWSAKQEYLK